MQTDNGDASEAAPLSRLTPDALRTARLLAEGLTDVGVARREGIDKRTVRRRVAALTEALGATTRFQAGYRLGLLDAAAVGSTPPRPRPDRGPSA